MGSKSKSASSKRTPALNESQNHAIPVSKRSKTSQNEVSSTISLQDQDAGSMEALPASMDLTTQMDRPQIGTQYEDDEDDINDIEMQGDDRESSDGDSDVEDDEDHELRANTATIVKKEAHTSDRVQKIMTNPEIEAAFHEQYMTQITQAFGDELNTLRETDSLEGPHLELLIDSLNQTGHIYSAVEKALWVAGAQ
ncbi:hypothetical protein BC939DRAFT_501638 [Gamsiella multidivaricata]|uniref:uncharacterized protein n=1 Tax=Gamsiella multidivaricata TaxID=101098 RepID=UPI00221F091E|nr:uncharacterized protein BC939DRAFT_501638 [Gamsiella multidivaricata]KAI7826995.1 hypothetical protein BC939DRAFT_501638 [Gamsiella multidivaricata]